MKSDLLEELRAVVAVVLIHGEGGDQRVVPVELH